MSFSPLLPPPKRFERSGGVCVLSRVRQVTLFAPEVLVRHHRVLRELFPRVQVTLETAPGYAVCLGAAQALASAPMWANEEAFRMEIVPEGLTLQASTARGLFYAVMTLQAMVGQSPEALPCGVIEDAPVRASRGLMLDVSRNRRYSLATLFDVIDKMARLRMNRLELYFEAIFAFKAHPRVWANTSPYTPEEIEALDAYCAERYIDLVPNQNTLGHFARWFEHPEYLRYAELPEGGARTPWGTIQTTPSGIATGSAEARAFVGGLLHELLPCFKRAKEVNLGGDEVFDLCQGRSKALNPDEAYVNHLRAMADIAEQYGKRPVFWYDMLLGHPEALALAKERLPEAMWVAWNYEKTDPLAAHAKTLTDAGLPIRVAPGSSSWNSFCGRTHNMLGNIHAAAQIESEGMLLTDWGDAGHWQPLTVTYPALVYAAALAWSPTAMVSLDAAVDVLTGTTGLGHFLLTLGETAERAHAEASNATLLFRAYNLPLEKQPRFDVDALMQTECFLDTLQAEGDTLGASLEAREARYAFELQQLAVKRALGRTGLQRKRAQIAARMELLWRERGPVADLALSLAAFNAPQLP